MTRILIVDDHAIVREGLRMLLEEAPDIEVAGEAANGQTAIEQALALQPDLVLLDLALPDIDGVEVARRILAGQPQSRILVLTSFADDQKVLAAMQVGVAGYLLKDVLRVDLLNAIEQVKRGEPALHPEAQRKLMAHVAQPTPPLETEPDRLTEREREVLGLIAKGYNNRQIAEALNITEGTVKGHVSNILSKLHLQDRTQAALYAVRHGLKE